jgi:hypothetical protein
MLIYIEIVANDLFATNKSLNNAEVFNKNIASKKLLYVSLYSHLIFI